MRSNDELRMDVMEAIKADPVLQEIAGQIGVVAKDGVVALSGIVNSYTKKLAVEDAAQLIPGVTVLACDVQVNAGTVPRGTDFEIAQEVNRALSNHQAAAGDRIRIKIDGRWVYLDGWVASQEEKKSLERTIGQIQGVRGVTSNITVDVVHLDKKLIQREIISGFHKMATRRALGIAIQVEGSKVIMDGAARSAGERNEVEEIVKNIRGVAVVDNRLVVVDTLQ